MTWCGLYIFFLFNFGTTLSLLSSFNKELKQRRSMHVNRKWDLYLSFIKLCHETHISIPNSLNRTLCPKIWASYCSAEYCPRCKRRTFGWRASGSKRLLSSLLKCWIYQHAERCISTSPSQLISQTCFKGKGLEFVVSRSRAFSFPLVFLDLQIYPARSPLFIYIWSPLTLPEKVSFSKSFDQGKGNLARVSEEF